MGDKDNKDKSRDLFSYEGDVPRYTAVDLLRDLQERLRRGEVYLQSGRDSVTLVPADRVRVRVRVREKGDEQMLRFELSWSHDRPRPSNGLVIGGPDAIDER